MMNWLCSKSLRKRAPEDMQQEGDAYLIVTPPDLLEDVRRALERAGVEISEAQLIREPSTTVAPFRR